MRRTLRDTSPYLEGYARELGHGADVEVARLERLAGSLIDHVVAPREVDSPVQAARVLPQVVAARSVRFAERWMAAVAAVVAVTSKWASKSIQRDEAAECQNKGVWHAAWGAVFSASPIDRPAAASSGKGTSRQIQRAGARGMLSYRQGKTKLLNAPQQT